MLFFIPKDLFLSHYVWQWLQCCLIYNKNGVERDKATQRFLVLTFFVDVLWLPQLSVDVLLCCFFPTVKLFKKFFFYQLPARTFYNKSNESLLLSVSPLPSRCIPLQIYPTMDMDGASSVVLQALTQATSQDTSVLKPAEEQLRQWETQPGFYSVLLVRNDIK